MQITNFSFIDNYCLTPIEKKQVENGGQPQVLMTSVDEVLEEDVDV